MRKIFLVICLLSLFCNQAAEGRIKPDDDYPFHFSKVISENPPIEQPFYLLSKSAYRLIDPSLPLDVWNNFINEARTRGFNSVRIWMMAPDWDYCNKWIAFPWNHNWEQGTPEYGETWYSHDNFDSAYWARLSAVLTYLNDRGMEAELCMLDWGSLARLPWVDEDNPDPNPYDGYAEGTKFLYLDSDLYDFGPDYVIPPAPDHRLKIYLDKIIEEARQWPNNWRLEIGNQMNDCFFNMTDGTHCFVSVRPTPSFHS